MDGQSISAIEPKSSRASTTAQPLLVKDVAPQPKPAAEPAPVYAQSVSEPPRAPVQPAAYPDMADPAPVETRTAAHVEPVAEEPTYSQPELYESPVSVEPEQRTAARVSQAPIDDAPLFAERSLSADDQRQQKGGWLSLFGGGRARQEPPAPLRDYRNDPTPVLQARAAAAAAQAVQPAPDEHAESTEDLEIPSFLRRLAN
jgi:cell division protein FtsZ